MIDLHFHSIFSDGDWTPETLAQQGRAIGLTAMALTDHDTTEGVPRFLDACRKEGVAACTGVEISAEYNPGTLHMLAYGFDLAHKPLQEALMEIREGRRLRNIRIIEKLQAAGCTLTMEEVEAEAGGEVVGRPHIAMVLEKKGYVKDKQEAFDRLLAKGKPAYVPRFRLTPEASIALIRQAGGVAVLAHPFSLDLEPKALRDLVRRLVEAGLGGVEVFYSEHTEEQTRLYRNLADEFGLLMTGGTDFHGRATPDLTLGRGFGNLRVPDELFSRLWAAFRHDGPTR